MLYAFGIFVKTDCRHQLAARSVQENLRRMSDQLFLPELMSDASIVATAKDIPNDALTTGLTNSVPTAPPSAVTSSVPQNVVSTQPSLVGSIIGDKCVLMQNF